MTLLPYDLRRTIPRFAVYLMWVRSFRPANEVKSPAWPV